MLGAFRRAGARAASAPSLLPAAAAAGAAAARPLASLAHLAHLQGRPPTVDASAGTFASFYYKNIREHDTPTKDHIVAFGQDERFTVGAFDVRRGARAGRARAAHPAGGNARAPDSSRARARPQPVVTARARGRARSHAKPSSPSRPSPCCSGKCTPTRWACWTAWACARAAPWPCG